jgi:hypothetical protein
VSYEQKTRFGGIKIEDVEDVTKLMRALVFYSGIDDRIFNGRGVADPIVKKQMKQFALNMQAAYALALISGGNGIDVHEPYWGT